MFSISEIFLQTGWVRMGVGVGGIIHWNIMSLVEWVRIQLIELE